MLMASAYKTLYILSTLRLVHNLAIQVKIITFYIISPDNIILQKLADNCKYSIIELYGLKIHLHTHIGRNK